MTEKDEIAALFRKKLSDHQEPVDPSVWNAIQGNLHASAAGPTSKAVSIAKTSGVIKTLVVSGLIVGAAIVGTVMYLNSTGNEDVSQKNEIETDVIQPQIPVTGFPEGHEATSSIDSKNTENQRSDLSKASVSGVQDKTEIPNSGASKEPIFNPSLKTESGQISNPSETIDTKNQPSKNDAGLPVAEQKKSPVGIGTDVITQTPKGEVTDNQYLTKEIPNIFTPNGDGLNDYFEIPLADGMKHQTKIFDKSGALIAEFDERLEGWNGTGRGAANVSDGTYFYVTFVSDGKSTPKQYKGSIILKR